MMMSDTQLTEVIEADPTVRRYLALLERARTDAAVMSMRSFPCRMRHGPIGDQPTGPYLNSPTPARAGLRLWAERTA